MKNDLHADVTITERTRVPVGWLVAGIGAAVSAALWLNSIQSVAADALRKSDANAIRMGAIESDIRVIREAQIRMETKLGLEPSYSKNRKE